MRLLVYACYCKVAAFNRSQVWTSWREN